MPRIVPSTQTKRNDSNLQNIDLSIKELVLKVLNSPVAKNNDNDKLVDRYHIEHVNNDDILETYEAIGKRIGAIIKGGEIDYNRVNSTILNDIKNELIKDITFDRL